MRTMFEKKPAFIPVDPCKILYNVGAMMDFPTGEFVRGLKGEAIMNGGLGTLVAIAGRPNAFKSTIAHYWILSATSKIASSGYWPYINTYDTENNMQPSRLLYFSQQFEEFRDKDIIEDGTWMVTDSTKHLGNEWFKILKEFLRNEKLKKPKDCTLPTPFADKHGKPILTLFPTFGEVDSLTKFITSDVEEMQNKNEIGESGGNMIFARAGLGKSRLLMELPILCASTGHYTVATAHVTQENMMGLQPHQTPTKKLQHMKQGEKIKGAPDDFFFLTNSLWQATSSVLLLNDTTKGPEYPITRTSVDKDSTDLNLVTLKCLRNKNGPSGHVVKLIISQKEGVKASLSEFHALKEAGMYGLDGANIGSCRLHLYPEQHIIRTTVRELLDNDPKMRRAVKITADFMQMKQLYRDLPLEIPDLKQLYDKLNKEYGWDTILNTRDYWTFNQYDHAVPFLSSLDLLELFHDIKKPYWWSPKTTA